MTGPAAISAVKPVRILHLEDNVTDAERVRSLLEADGLQFDVRRAETPGDFEAMLKRDEFDLILSDYSLPGPDGLSALKTAQKTCPHVPFIFVSGMMGESVAVESLKSGAVDYVIKDQLYRLAPAVRRALGEAAEKKGRRQVEEELRHRNEQFRQITENVDDLITVLDLQGRHIFNSPSFRRLGLDPLALVGMDGFAAIHSEDRDRIRELFRTTVATGTSQHCEFRYLLPDGRLRHFESQGSVIRGQDGTVASVVVVSRDITERKLVEERLRLLEAAVQNANEAVIITTADLSAPGPEIVFANPAFTAMTGFSPAEVVGLSPQLLRDPPAGPQQLEALRQTLRKGGPLYGETLNHRRDGTACWVEWYVMPLRNAEGRTTHYVTVQRDVTQRKRAEAQIREQAALLDQAHDAICVMDMEQHILYWNHGAELLFGWDAATVQGRSAVQLLFDGDQPSLAAALKGLINRGEWRGEITQRTRTGHKIIVESRWTLLRDDQGRPRSILLINTDITERKLAELKMRQQAALLDQAQDAIFVCDLERRVTYWNKGAERMYGWTAAEMLGRPASVRLYRPGLPDLEETWKTALEAGEWSGELAQVTKDGKELIVAGRRTLLRDAPGKPAAFLNIYTDITERKQLESQFLRNQRLENIGALAGGIAHDLNNVLSPILLVADVLRNELSSEENRQMLDTVKTSAERGADLVRQVLSFARGAGGSPVVFDLRHVIRDVIRMARSTFPPSIQIDARSAGDLHSVRGDPTRLHQVLLNLCVNARDAMPHGGRLLIEAENVSFDARVVAGRDKPASGQHVVLTVTDTGTGVPPELLEKIFVPFFTTKDASHGTGLGLSTVANIVRDHGGFVEVLSRVGEGSSFQVYLPAALGAEPAPSIVKPTEPPLGHNERILLVDDDRAVLEMTRQALKAYHYDVVVAKDGAEALAAYQKQTGRIDLVITDVQMPVMDGPAFVREIRRLDPHLKIICVSGLASEARLAELDRSQISVVLGKPYTAEKLLSTVRQVIVGG